MCGWIYLNFMYICLIVSSPYLLVFGDGRICITHEQMISRMVLVRYKVRAGITWEKALSNFLLFMVLNNFVNLYIIRLEYWI